MPNCSNNIANPTDHGTSDCDISVLIWRNGNKTLVLHLNIYGSFTAIGGLSNPARGTVVIHKFEEAWKWFCDPEEILPKYRCIECLEEVNVMIGVDYNAKPPFKRPLPTSVCKCGCKMEWFGNVCKRII